MTKDERKQFMIAYQQAIAAGVEQAPHWDRRISDTRFDCVSTAELYALDYFLTMARVEGYAALLHNRQRTELPPALDDFEKRLILLSLVGRLDTSNDGNSPFDCLIRLGIHHAEFEADARRYLMGAKRVACDSNGSCG